MPWTNKQKFMVHLYHKEAGLADQDYRGILYDATGCTSAAHLGLTQHDFDVTMARLEGVLWQRVEEGIVDRPDTRRISNLSYWRNRLPRHGEANSRQIHEVYDWWYKLQPYLPPEKRTKEYLRSIAAKATGRKVESIPQLMAWQAGVVIEAVKDRLRWAIKDRSPEEAAPAAVAEEPAQVSAACPILPALDVATDLATDDVDQQAEISTAAAGAVRPPELAMVGVSDGPTDRVTAGGILAASDEELPF